MNKTQIKAYRQTLEENTYLLTGWEDDILRELTSFELIYWINKYM
jgi:hypothetical protein